MYQQKEKKGQILAYVHVLKRNIVHFNIETSRKFS